MVVNFGEWRAGPIDSGRSTCDRHQPGRQSVSRAGWQAIHFLKTIKFPIEYTDVDSVTLSLFYLVARKYVESGRR